MKSSIVVNPNAFRAELFKCFFYNRRIKVYGKDFICIPAVSDSEYLVSVFKEDEMVDLRYHDQPPLVNAYFNHYVDVKKCVALRSLEPQDYYRYFFAESCYIVSLMDKFVPNESPVNPYTENNDTRKEHIRKHAIMVLELTKGFTPEQRENMGNNLISLEDMAHYVLELTNELIEKDVNEYYDIDNAEIK